MNNMKFEWDEDKNQINIAKHGIGFEKACLIFNGPTLDRVDDRKDYGEKRIISLGIVEDVLVLVVVHTDRDGVIRLISARPAKRSERSWYEKAIQKRTDS